MQALLELHKKIKDAFKKSKVKDVLPHAKLVADAQKYSNNIRRNQMKGFGAIWAILLPLLPKALVGLGLVAWDAYLGPSMFAKSFALLDGVVDKVMSVEEFKYVIIQVTSPFPGSFWDEGVPYTDHLTSICCVQYTVIFVLVIAAGRLGRSLRAKCESQFCMKVGVRTHTHTHTSQNAWHS